MGGFSADLFWNHVGCYHNWISTTVAPITIDAVGNPIGGGDKVKAGNTSTCTSNMSSVGRTSCAAGRSIVDVQNMFDKNPPFYNGNTNGIMGGASGL